MARNKKRPLLPFILIFTLLLFVMIFAIVFGLIQTDEPKPQIETVAEPRANEYHADAFYYNNGFMRYSDSAHMVGIDVSVHQGVIDWHRVKSAGVEFAIIRLGYRGSSEGGIYEDERFHYNLQNAKDLGIQVGLYFFSQAISTEEALEEAEFVLSTLANRSLDLPIYFDWEYLQGRIDTATDINLTEFALTFCERIESAGYKAGVYFNQSFGYTKLDLLKLESYHLWLAEYNETPSFRYHFDCLQYSDNGTIDGIHEPVDLNLLFINKAE